MNQVETPKSLPKSQKAFYGIGHVLNDLCANCWFSYALIYWTKIIGLSETNAGLLLLIGQIADAISTVFIGQVGDRTKFRWYGKRKLWHIIGTVCVMLSFPFIFNLCLTCGDSTDMKKLLYYAGFVIVFQFGWAATENSHLALIPDIAHRVSDVIHLNSIRSGLSFVCGIFVYAVTWFLLGRADGEDVDSSLAPQFKILSIIVICVGLVFVLIFHFGTKEKVTRREQKNYNIDSQAKSEGGKKTWKQWLKDPIFYKTGLLYMSTRLGINIFQSFFVLYLTDALGYNKEAIAYFPLILLISGALTSPIMQKLTKKIGSQLTYILGASLIIGSSVWLFATDESGRNSVYGATVLAGCGISIILVTSLAKTADMIGKEKKSGAFVYSCMSFLDKLATGIGIFTIQALKPIPDENEICTDCKWFSKIVQSVVPGTCALIGLLSMMYLFPSEFMFIRKSELAKEQISTSSLNAIEDNDAGKKTTNLRNKKIKTEQRLEIFYEPSTRAYTNESFQGDVSQHLDVQEFETTSSAMVTDEVELQTNQSEETSGKTEEIADEKLQITCTMMNSEESNNIASKEARKTDL